MMPRFSAMLLRSWAMLLIAMLLLGCGRAARNSGETVVGHAEGLATYQTVAGQRAEVRIAVRDFTKPVPHLVVVSSGPDNWFHDHVAVTQDLGSWCGLKASEIDCGAFHTREYGNIWLSGIETHAGQFHYTLTFWGDQDGQRELIRDGTGRALSVSWIEHVTAP